MTDPLDDPIGLEVALASGAPPDLLVPCDVEGLLDAAQALRSHASVLEDGGAALARVEVTNWRGRAADGFTDVLTPEPARWRAAADGFSAGAVALEAFVACIAPARSTASDAIALWQRYLATAAAAADVAQAPVQPTVGATMQIGARLAQQQQAAATSPTAAALTADADDLRRQAITTLAAARRQVQSAGDVAASTLSRAADAAPQARRFWETTIRPADVIAAGHSALDVLGMVPALGAIPDAANACWYALKGDGVNAALSAAGTIPFFGDAALFGRMVRSVARRPAKLTSELANPMPEILFIAGSRTDNNLTPRLQDVKGLSSYDNIGAPIFKPGDNVQPLDPSKLKDVEVHGPDARDGHYSLRPGSLQSLLDWQAARNGPLAHPYTQELRASMWDAFKLPKKPSPE